MSSHTNCHCCPQYFEESSSESQLKISRRNFVAMGGVLLGGLNLSGLRNSAFAAEKNNLSLSLLISLSILRRRISYRIARLV